MKIAIGIIVAALLAFGAFVYFGDTKPTTTETMKTYSSEKYGITFQYPAEYYLEEREVGNGERGHYVVTLYEDTEENTAVREGRAPAREGPVSVTVDIYQNDLDRMTAEEWIRNTNDSNFKMSPDSVLTPYTVGGLAGYIYRWSGLYEAVAVAVASESRVYAFTATYITPEDSIRAVFDAVVASAVIR